VTLAIRSVLAIAGIATLTAVLHMPSAHAQIGSFTSPELPPSLLRGTCFAAAGVDRHFRVEEVRNGWVRVATAADKNQTNPFVKVESRWLHWSRFPEVVTLSGPKACDFLD
jgi:hypothetical protein